MYNDFVKAITNKKQKTILAHFKNNVYVEYTTAIFDLLKTDKNIDCILDAETGEIIFEKD